MPDNKKLDEILKEYAPDESPEPVRSSGEEPSREQTAVFSAVQPVGDTAVFTRQDMKAVEDALLKRPAQSHRYGKFAVSDVSRPNVSYINSVTEVRRASADLPPKPTDLIEGYDGAVMMPQPEDDTYVPKVRKMSNSTRAKEMRESRRKKSKKRKKPDFTYTYESPDGIYTTPQKKNRKFVINRDAGDEPPEPKDDGNIVPLSEMKDPGALDIRIAEPDTPDDHKSGGRKKGGKHKKSEKPYSKTQSVRDYDSYENAREIRKSINEVKENISFRITVLAVMMVFSSFLAFGGKIGLPVFKMLDPAVSPKAYCYVQLIVLVLSAAIAVSTFRNGLVSLLRFRPDSDGIAALAMTASIIASFSATFAPELVSKGKIYIYAPVSILCLLVNSIGKKLILTRMAMNFDYISKSKDISAIVCVEDVDRAESLTRGTIGDYPILAAMKPVNFLKDFAKLTYSADAGDRFSSAVSPLILLFSLISAAAVTFVRMRTFSTEALAFGIGVFAASVCACSCVAIPLVANIPLHKASKKYVRNHGVMLGYQSVDDFYDTNSVMVSADCFFPGGTVTLADMKLFTGSGADTALSEAASLAVHGGSILKDLFTDIIKDKQKPLYRVENFVYEDSMGLCGWINNRRILLGNRELMLNHKIDGIPTTTKEREFTNDVNEALYLSVSGSLTAMFSVSVSATPRLIKFMRRLERKNIAVIVKTVDCFITIHKLSALLDYPEDLIKIIPPRMVKDFDEETKGVKKISSSMACSGKFMSFMQLIMGTKSIRGTVTAGIVLQSAAALLGFVMIALNYSLNAMSNVSPLHIMGYQLISIVLTAAAVKIRKV